MKFLIVPALALSLAGCVSLGVSQQDSETAYTVSTIAGDVFLLSGQANGVMAGQACVADMATYRILIATRNVADNVSYVPADSAHLTLQKDGAKLNPAQCNQG